MFGSPRKRGAGEVEEDAQSRQENNCTCTRSGKWSVEEEKYASELIRQFDAGVLTDCIDGCTLRAYLSKKLNCAPMRVSKKYAGQSIGKHSYTKKVVDQEKAHGSFSIRQRSSCSCDVNVSSHSTLSEQDLIIQARRAEISFKTLAEFQTHNHTPGVVQYLHQPIPLMSVPSPGTGSRSTAVVYPMSYYESPAQFQTMMVTQQVDDFEHPVGLDIDDLHEQHQPLGPAQQRCSLSGMHSVSTDSSYSSSRLSTSSVASTELFFSSSTTNNERYVRVGGTCRTPEVSPNLVSSVHLMSDRKASSDPIAVLAPGHPFVPKHGRKRCPSEEAEEWHEVLSYFTKAQRPHHHVHRPGESTGHHVCSPGERGEGGASMMSPTTQTLTLPREESCHLLGHHGSFSTVFL